MAVYTVYWLLSDVKYMQECQKKKGWKTWQNITWQDSLELFYQILVMWCSACQQHWTMSWSKSQCASSDRLPQNIRPFHKDFIYYPCSKIHLPMASGVSIPVALSPLYNALSHFGNQPKVSNILDQTTALYTWRQSSSSRTI